MKKYSYKKVMQWKYATVKKGLQWESTTIKKSTMVKNCTKHLSKKKKYINKKVILRKSTAIKSTEIKNYYSKKVYKSFKPVILFIIYLFSFKLFQIYFQNY